MSTAAEPTSGRWRRLARRSLQIGAVLAVTIGAVAGARHGAEIVEFVRDHPYFRVERIHVHGAGPLVSGEELKAWIGLSEGDSLWLAAPARIERRLAAHPMIAAATVRRTFPDTLEVRVRERRPAAIAMLDDLYYLDRDGETFGPLGPRHDRDYPVFTGVGGTEDFAAMDAMGGMAGVATSVGVYDLMKGEEVESADGDGQRRWALRRALQLLRRWDRREGGLEVSELHLDPHAGLVLHPVKPRVPLYLGWRGWQRRLQRAERVLASWQGSVERLARVDLRYRGQVIVELREPRRAPTNGKVSA